MKRRNWLIENFRLQQTYNTIYRYVADITVSRTPLIAIRHAVQRWIYGEKTHDDLTAPQKVRILLQDLGPDLRQDRPDGVQPAGIAARRLPRRTGQAAKHRAPVSVRSSGGNDHSVN